MLRCSSPIAQRTSASKTSQTWSSRSRFTAPRRRASASSASRSNRRASTGAIVVWTGGVFELLRVGIGNRTLQRERPRFNRVRSRRS
ncbi:MAG: hypothetical protein Q6370_010570 [Candidatus Sigynarchaeota archaeon]